jgi:hypothetical protein
MAHLFISHVEEDESIALELAALLEESGFRTWYYERDSYPGLSYLIQTGQAIEDSAAVIVIISPGSLGSPQLTKEIVRAHEAGKPFIPILKDVSHREFQQRQPEWREAIGSSTSILLPSDGLRSVLPKIIGGLNGLGLQGLDELKRKPVSDRSSDAERLEVERIIGLFPDIRSRQ